MRAITTRTKANKAVEATPLRCVPHLGRSPEMNMTSAKIPIWKAGGIAMVAYLLALVTLGTSVNAANFWGELFATPRFRAGFVFYSLPFFLVGAVLIAVGRWLPSRAPLIITRRVVVGLSISVLILAVGLMNVFGSGFDFKLSGP